MASSRVTLSGQRCWPDTADPSWSSQVYRHSLWIRTVLGRNNGKIATNVIGIQLHSDDKRTELYPAKSLTMLSSPNFLPDKRTMRDRR